MANGTSTAQHSATPIARAAAAFAPSAPALASLPIVIFGAEIARTSIAYLRRLRVAPTFDSALWGFEIMTTIVHNPFFLGLDLAALR